MSKTPRTLSEPKSYTDLEYAVMYKSRCEKLETELAEARAEIEKFNNLFKNGIDCFMSPCERHSGENTPPFDEFIKKYGHECTPCLVEELADARTEIERLRAEM